MYHPYFHGVMAASIIYDYANPVSGIKSIQLDLGNQPHCRLPNIISKISTISMLLISIDKLATINKIQLVMVTYPYEYRHTVSQ